MSYLTVPELQRLVQQRKIKGRSKLRNRAQLLNALGLAEISDAPQIQASSISSVAPAPPQKPLAPRPVPSADSSIPVTASGLPRISPFTESRLPPLSYGQYTSPQAQSVPKRVPLPYQPSASSSSSSSSQKMIPTEEMLELAADLYAEADYILESEELNFETFMYWLNTVVYINTMETSGEFTAEDMSSFNVDERFEDEVAFDTRSGFVLFHEFKGLERTPTSPEVQIALKKFQGRYVDLFQTLYQQYVDPDYELRPADQFEDFFLR